MLVRLLSFSRNAIDALFNIARLLAHLTNHAARVCVKNAIAVYVADVANGGAHALLEIKLRIACYLPRDNDEVSFRKSLAGYAAQGVLFETGIKNAIADGVANFVGMTFGDGL